MNIDKDLQTLKENLGQIKKIVAEFEQNLQNLEESISMAKARNNFSQIDLQKEILLENAMVGKPYKDLLNASLFELPNIFIAECDGLKDTGITFNLETNTFEGIPLVAGTFEAELFYKESIEHTQEYSCKILLTINPNPDSLWLNLDTDPTAPYQKENSYSEYTSADEFDILSASIRGRSHAHVGTFRDDHFIQKYFNGKGWHFQAISDGAGSAKYARKGSEIACETVLTGIETYIQSDEFEKFEDNLRIKYAQKDDRANDELNTQLYYLTVGNAYKAYQAIKQEAENMQCQAKDYSATLLFTLHKQFEFGTVLISFWVGDGAIGALVEDEILLLGTPDGGEFAGQTRFVTMPEIFKTEDVTKRIGFRCTEKPLKALFLMSDGISDPKFETDSNLTDVQLWETLWAELQTEVLAKEDKGKALETWMNFHSKGNHDDRSLSILFPKKLLVENPQEVTTDESNTVKAPESEKPLEEGSAGESNTDKAPESKKPLEEGSAGESNTDKAPESEKPLEDGNANEAKTDEAPKSMDDIENMFGEDIKIPREMNHPGVPDQPSKNEEE